MAKLYFNILPSELRFELFNYLSLGAAIYYCLTMKCSKKLWKTRLKRLHPEVSEHVKSLETYLNVVRDTDEIYDLAQYILRYIQEYYEDELDTLRIIKKIPDDQMPSKKYFIVSNLNNIHDLQYDKYIKDIIFTGYNFYDVFLKVRRYVKEITGGKTDVINDLLKDITYYELDFSGDIIEEFVSNLADNNFFDIEESELIDDPSTIDELIAI